MRVEELAELNPYAVAVRYADDWREPQLSDARRALALASKVRAVVRKLMPPPVLEWPKSRDGIHKAKLRGSSWRSGASEGR